MTTESRVYKAMDASDEVVVSFNWVSVHNTDTPSGTIALTHGYIEKIDPLPLADAIGWNLAVYPIPKFGFVQGPMLEGEIVCDFMLDMKVLLFTYGFIALYDPNITDADAEKIVTRAFVRKIKSIDDLIPGVSLHSSNGSVTIVGDHQYEYEVDGYGKILRRRQYDGTPGGMVRRECRGCGRLLVIRRGRQRFVRAPYIWAGKAFCNTCAETREQQDDPGAPWEEPPWGEMD
jgi:hypothetical protein